MDVVDGPMSTGCRLVTDWVTFQSNRQITASNSTPARTDSTIIHRGVLGSSCPGSGEMRTSICRNRNHRKLQHSAFTCCLTEAIINTEPSTGTCLDTGYYLCTVRLLGDREFIRPQLQRCPASNQDTSHIAVVLKHPQMQTQFLILHFNITVCVSYLINIVSTSYCTSLLTLSSFISHHQH